MDDNDVIRQYWMQTPAAISPGMTLCSISSMLPEDPFEWIVEKARMQTRILGTLLGVPEPARGFILDAAIERLQENKYTRFRARILEDVRDTYFSEV
jgi:hypothetical protein